MGYWPAKLITVLNIILLIGWSVINSILGGQILSAISDGSMSIAVGIVIIALISWAVAVFGMSPFHIYERYARVDLPSPTGNRSRRTSGQLRLWLIVN